METNLKYFIAGLFTGLIICVVAILTVERQWEDKSIEKGFAHRDSKTGEWMWNNTNKTILTP